MFKFIVRLRDKKTLLQISLFFYYQSSYDFEKFDFIFFFFSIFSFFSDKYTNF